MSEILGRTTFAAAINDALSLALERDPSVYVLGLGVSDPTGVFGTTLGLAERFGSERVMDMPTAESAMTGVAIGTAVAGMRPVMSHHRVEFALLAVEQIVNQAAKWRYMFGGRMNVPIVIRLLVGRGWGQGPQHSQSLHAWFAHVPGLKVVMPVAPAEAKGLLLAAIEDDDPVLFIEHRWLHRIDAEVPDGYYTVPLGRARVAREGSDLSIVASSYMVVEAMRAAAALAEEGIEAEVIDLQSLRPLDDESVLASVRKTGRVLVVDQSWKQGGFAGEIVSLVAEDAFDSLRKPPRRVAMPDVPVPTSAALARFSYPGARDLVAAAYELLDRGVPPIDEMPLLAAPVHLDVPDSSFVGPF